MQLESRDRSRYSERYKASMFDHNNMEATLAVSCGQSTDDFKGVAGLLTRGATSVKRAPSDCL